MDSTKKRYQEWCARIAEDTEMAQLISHFREHVGAHYSRENNRGTEKSFKNWIAGVFNFLAILERKYPQVTTEDKLYKLCKYYRKHKDFYKDNKEGPEAAFDVDKYMKEYRGDME
ncbi:MAG: hypothetical protein NTZ49_01205 [Candidatus Parcubacteria bacterium]|nr:hypothetical protein [Candidatus Parcubacteria bacterium]